MKFEIGDKIDVDHAINPCLCIYSEGDEFIFISQDGEVFGYNGNDDNEINCLRWSSEKYSFSEHKEPKFIPYTAKTFDRDRDLFFKFNNGEGRARALSYGKDGICIGGAELLWIEFFQDFTHFDGSPAGYLEE